MPPVRAAFCTAKNTIEVRETDDPQPGSGEVLVRVRQCGICGTDLHFYNGHLPPSPASLGHEFTGEVAALGQGVEGFAEGDRVAVRGAENLREGVEVKIMISSSGATTSTASEGA